MVLHPEVLAKAQREMDDVIGTGRLPTIEDRPSLPYLDCILKETWRYVTSTKNATLHTDECLEWDAAGPARLL